MAIQLVFRPKKYIGLSSDTKPTGAPVGSEYYETNTGQNYIYNGSNWIEDLSLVKAFSQVLNKDK